MKKYIILGLLLLISVSGLLAANWTQYYFRFEIKDRSEIKELTTIISIDNVRGNWIYAYANDEEWNRFTKLGYNPQLLPNPGDLISPTMATTKDQMRDWTSYPTYETYVSMMFQFAADYPNICQIIDAGTTVNNRKILFVKISDNVGFNEAEPEVMYTATMHGDETTGYILMLRLIDTLLSQYGTNQRTTDMVNNLEIWINPNANPDGTYYGGNSSVTGSRRANANGYDLNRNFPFAPGEGTNSYPLQIETTHMINIANTHNWVLSANFHGGAEVVNYLWDTWSALHPDDSWLASISAAYAASCHANAPTGYLDDLNNGITNGYAWYSTTGGRQDWMCYAANGREATIEVSATKLLPAAQLNTYWNYNADALLGYLESAYYGIHGTVHDPYGNPLDVTITVLGHDTNFTKVVTDPENGDFYRFLSPGTYSLTFSASGYPDKTVNNVIVTANQKTELDVMMGELPHTQAIPLSEGWNLISFNVQLPTSNVADLFAPVSANLLQVKDTAQSYSPQMAQQFNTLSTIQTGNGYWVNMSAPATLSIVAPIINTSSNPIALNTGWNLVSFLPDTTMQISTALSSISSYLISVQSITDTWSFSRSGGTLTIMEPGKAYWINVSQPCQLTYP
ncbi:MAG: zinc carboxypeptidase [Candidatus Cloacimonetes bacterium HGW-Cloacimonetes-1]|jgi:hypothetical protein|nr:MAG: zinc carboxypeptidase [Candidatus Cloacimonetes bacterium HGW-Cloacimonetes-1]